MNAKLKNRLVFGAILLFIVGIGIYSQLNKKKSTLEIATDTQVQQTANQPSLVPTNFPEPKRYSSLNLNISFKIKEGFSVSKDSKDQVNIGLINEQQHIPEAIVITKNKADFINPTIYEICIEKEGELIPNTPCVSRGNRLDSLQTIGGRKTNHFYLVLGQDAGTEVYETVEEPIIQARSSLVGGGNPLYSLLLTLVFN